MKKINIGDAAAGSADPVAGALAQLKSIFPEAVTGAASTSRCSKS